MNAQGVSFKNVCNLTTHPLVLKDQRILPPADPEAVDEFLHRMASIEDTGTLFIVSDKVAAHPLAKSRLDVVALSLLR